MIEQVNNGIANTLYEVSSALLLPVMLAVLVSFVATLAMLGGLVREAFDRRRARDALRNALNVASLRHPGRHAVLRALEAAPSGLGRRFSRRVQDFPITATTFEKALIDLEGDVAVALGRVGFIARVGPMLGLLGTLIPFGPALAGLSSGDIQTLSANLVTAFATTVVGLLCGAIAFAVGAVRRGWYTRDFDDLEFIVQRINEDHRHEKAQDQEVGSDGRGSDLRVDQFV